MLITLVQIERFFYIFSFSQYSTARAYINLVVTLQLGINDNSNTYGLTDLQRFIQFISEIGYISFSAGWNNAIGSFWVELMEMTFTQDTYLYQ
jgi:hypothetical protein